MRITKLLKRVFKPLLDEFQTEAEILRLRLIRMGSLLLANLIAVAIIVTLLTLTLAIVAIWIGFYLGEVLDSLSLGFGIAALIYIGLLALLVIFRNSLLIRPFTNFCINLLIEVELEDDDQGS